MWLPICERVRLQPFRLDHFEHRFADRGSNRISAEGVEMNPLRRVTAAIFGVVTTAAERTAVADALGHA